MRSKPVMDGAREDGRTKLVDDFGVGGGKGNGVVASVQIGGDARCRRRGTGEPRRKRLGCSEDFSVAEGETMDHAPDADEQYEWPDDKF